jgi:hypothetical protein
VAATVATAAAAAAAIKRKEDNYILFSRNIWGNGQEEGTLYVAQ